MEPVVDKMGVMEYLHIGTVDQNQMKWIMDANNNDNRSDVMEAFINFYVLEALDQAIIGHQKQQLRKVGIPERWVSDYYDLAPNNMLETAQSNISHIRRKYNQKLARSIHDYLVLACAGEARHHKKMTYPEGKISDRHKAATSVIAYDPRTVIPWLEYIFNDCYWSGSFGGKTWGRLAQAARLYYEVPPEVFIDHCVDLQHHGGLAYNKGYILSFIRYAEPTVKEMIEHKANRSILEYETLPLYPVVFDALKSLVGALPRTVSHLANKFTIYPIQRDFVKCSVKWGKKTWNIDLIEGSNNDEEDEDTESTPVSEYCSIDSDGHHCGNLAATPMIRKTNDPTV